MHVDFIFFFEGEGGGGHQGLIHIVSTRLVFTPGSFQRESNEERDRGRKRIEGEGGGGRERDTRWAGGGVGERGRRVERKRRMSFFFFSKYS